MPAPNAPRIRVDGNSVVIANGDTTPAASDRTDFGPADVTTGTITRTFTIRNVGSAPLNLSGTPNKIAVSGTNAADFSVTVPPSSPVAITTGSTTFQVTFDPSAIGTRTASISIASDDVNKNPYTFSIQGKGTSVLTVSGITATNKIYDGNNTAALNTTGVSLIGVIGSDAVNLVVTSATGAFTSKNAGTGKTVNVTGLTINGTDAGNYVLIQPSITASITCKTITVTGVTANNREYDGTTTAALNTSTAAIVGVISSDIVNPVVTSATGTFDTKNVGTGKTVNVTGLTIGGADAGNYILVQPSITANITTKTLTVNGVTANNKEYDGNITAAINTSGAALAGVIGNDVVNLNVSSAAGTFNNSSPGTGKTVTISGLSITGTDAANYILTQPATTADILSPSLSVAGQGIEIANGNNVPSTSNNTDFGSVVVGPVNLFHAFTIRNTGTSNLNFTGTPAIALNGPDAQNFSVTGFASPVTPGNSTTFQIGFAPTSSGIKTARIIISSNDASKNPYTFSIQGTGYINVPPPSAPPVTASNHNATVVTRIITPTTAAAATPTSTPANSTAAKLAGQVIAKVNSDNTATAHDAKGHPLSISGNLITMTENQGILYINIPVSLQQGDILSTFRDTNGLTFANNKLAIPLASLPSDSRPLFQVSDENGDLGTTLIIETENAIGGGDKATARIVSMTTNSSFANRDFTAQNAKVGKVSSKVDIDINKLPDDAKIKLTTSLLPDAAAGSAFQLIAGHGNTINIAYTINFEKTNLQNGADIRSATITMVVGPDWVNGNGGVKAVHFSRYDPETKTTKVLDTTFTGYDAQGRAVFTALSPGGLSVFALTAQSPSPGSAANKTKPSKNTIWIIGLTTGLVVILSAAAFLIINRRIKRKGQSW